jgi:hypothetical protein
LISIADPSTNRETSLSLSPELNSSTIDTRHGLRLKLWPAPLFCWLVNCILNHFNRLYFYPPYLLGYFHFGIGDHSGSRCCNPSLPLCLPLYDIDTWSHLVEHSESTTPSNGVIRPYTARPFKTIYLSYSTHHTTSLSSAEQPPFFDPLSRAFNRFHLLRPLQYRHMSNLVH